MGNKYYIESLGDYEYVHDTNDKIVTFPTAKEFMSAFADAGDDKTQLDELKENAEKLLKRYHGTDEENKEQIFELVNIVINDDTGEQEDLCEKFDDSNYEATFVLESQQKLKMMNAPYDNTDTLEILDDAVEIELISTESTKELKGHNTNSCNIYNILDDSVDKQFIGYDMFVLYIHRKITEQWLTDNEKEEYSKLLGGNKFNHCQRVAGDGTYVEMEPSDILATNTKIAAYNILAATRLARNILNTDY